MERASALASDRSARKSSRRSALIAAGWIVVTGVALAVAFFPMMFSQWLTRDDEGVFEYGLREFLHHHGHLYSTIWSDFYGPFYYLVMSTVFRVIHQQPSLENARWIVLILTTASAAFFAGSVWRVTKSWSCALLCEVASFIILIGVAGNEPLHPGSLGVLLVSLVAFELSSYAATRRTADLVGIGAATGALIMTKVNVGGLVAVAVVFGFLVGSEKVPRWVQITVAALAALVPVALVSQNISANWAAIFATLVSISIVGLFAVAFIDQASLPRQPLLPIAASAAAVIVFSLAFPLLSGTSVSDEVSGVFIRPLTLPNAFTVPANIHINWVFVVLTAAGIYAAIAFRSLSKESVATQSTWTHAALAGLGLWLIGLGATFFVRTWAVAEWLPTIVLLPALAICANSAEPIRLALRWLVILATLQILVAYPVAGSQVGWGTAVMVAPCAIAMAAGIDHSRLWRESSGIIKGLATATVCLALIVAIDVWPPNIWKTYLDNSSFGVPGTGLMRVDPGEAATIQSVVQTLRAQCDTFYGIPSENSFYVFTGLPPATEMLANGGPAGLTQDQQAEVLQQLEQKQQAGERVCILTDTTQNIQLPPGPLTDALSQYTTVVGTVAGYTISRHS